MYKLIFAAALVVSGLLIWNSAQAEESNDCFLCGEREWSVGGGAGADINGDYNAIIVSGNWLPIKRSLGTGVITSLQLGQYDYDEGSGQRVAVAAVPVLTYHGFYAGMGVSLGNTTPYLGTVWNFASVGGYRHTFDNGMFVDFSLTHESHAARAGVEKDKPNGGVTMVVGQWGVRF